MKALHSVLAAMLVVFAIQSISYAQSSNVTESLKNHFNETVQAVHETDDVDEKRTILDDSFNRMITALNRIESLATLTEEENSVLLSYKFDLTEKQSELNGMDGFDEVMDDDLNDFSDYSQNFIEQANRTLTIGVSTAVLILIILLLI